MASEKASILVIEDNEPVRALLRTALEDDGYRVVEASDGREGLAMYHHERPDLIITDLVMPNLNGTTLMSTLAALPSGPKMIAMTGVTGPCPELEVARGLGARIALRKPFSMRLLLDAVHSELAHLDP